MSQQFSNIVFLKEPVFLVSQTYDDSHHVCQSRVDLIIVTINNKQWVNCSGIKYFQVI